MEQEVQPHLPPVDWEAPPLYAEGRKQPCPLGRWETSSSQTWNILLLPPGDRGCSTIFQHLGGSLSSFPGVTGSPALLDTRQEILPMYDIK